MYKNCDKYIIKKCDMCMRDVYDKYYFSSLCFDCIKQHKTIRDKTCWDFILEFFGL